MQKGIIPGMWILALMNWTSEQGYVFHLCQPDLLEGELIYDFITGVHIVFISVLSHPPQF